MRHSFSKFLLQTYISEVSTQSLRGLLCSGNQLFITIGIFIVYGLGKLSMVIPVCGDSSQHAAYPLF